MSFKRSLPVGALLGILALIHAFSMGKLSFTYDEVPHMLYGLRVMAGNSDRFDDSKMPVSALNALPLWLDGVDEKRLLASADPTVPIRPGRGVTALCSLLLGVVVFRWAYELYGYAAGLLALTLFVFEPNLTAHSQLVTTDLYAVLFTTLSLYTFWRFLKKPTVSRLSASAFTLGLAQVAKYSATYLYPVFILIGLVWLWRQPNRRALWRPCLGAVAVYALLNLAVINTAFLFNRTLMRWGDYQFKSSLFQGLQRGTSALGSVPVPLPYPYVQGLDLVKFGDESGAGFGRIYLLGEVRTGRGFAGYYPVAFLFKTPLGLQALLLWAAIQLWRKRRDLDFVGNELFLLWPALFFAIYFSFLFNAQIGLRYLLVIYPLLIVVVSGLLRDWPQVAPKLRAACAVLVACIAVSSLSYFGHTLSYFNELVGHRMNSYRIMADSNLDWGQNRYYLREYLDAHPDTIYNPAAPQPGRFIVDVNIVTGVATNRNGGWVRAFEPKDHLVYTYLIYEITPKDLANLGAAPRPGG